jgi:hypothetical protein
MNKRSIHHLLSRIKPIKTWYFLVAFLICAAVSVLALRHNYATMVELRNDVYTADKNDTDVLGSLNRLRAYVNSHMNTDLASSNGIYPPIHLTYTYERLKKAEQDKVNDANSKIYTDAQHYCENLFPGSFSGGPRVPCIEQYVKDHGAAAKTIPDALYKFNFASPNWSPDAAGWSMVLSCVFLALAVIRFLLGRVLESLAK